MTGTYYYLVAGLPDLILDGGKLPCSCIEFIEEASSILDDGDLALFNLLRLPFDNHNLLTLLGKKNRPFDKRGTIAETDLAGVLAAPEAAPRYMQLFLETFYEKKPPVKGLTADDHLAWFFYEAMTSHPHPFIRDWFTFDLNVRNCAAAINSRKGYAHFNAFLTGRSPSLDEVIIGRNEVASSLLTSPAPDFGVAHLLSWIDKALSMSNDGVLDFEKGLDTLRWETLCAMTQTSYFKAETVFAFFIKLTLVERWLALDPATGQARLDRLIDEMKTSYSMASTGSCNR
jgi:hypothetical protein